MSESTENSSSARLVGMRQRATMLHVKGRPGTPVAEPAIDVRVPAIARAEPNVRQKIGFATLCYLFFVIAAANSFFTLVPWFHVSGTFNAMDVGNGLLMLGVAILSLRARDLSAFRNPFSLLFVLYLTYIPIEAMLASVHFHQSLLDGFIAMRHQMYYLSFFVFLLTLDTPKKLQRFLDLLTVLAVVLLILSVINYAGFTIFYGSWAQGWGARSGVERATIPGMDILTLAFLWESSKWIASTNNADRRKAGRWTLVLAAGHFFRQTRSRIVGLTLVLIAVLISKGRLRTVAAVGLVGLVGVGASLLLTKHDIVLQSYTTAIGDLQQGQGTWAARLSQVALDMQMFDEYPVFGSGAAAIRFSQSGPIPLNEAQLAAIAHMEDLGYTHWLKAYGAVGAVWLVAFFYLLWRKARELQRTASREHEPLALFCVGYVGFLVISSVTLNHLTLPPRIILVCLVAAILVRMVEFRRSRPI